MTKRYSNQRQLSRSALDGAVYPSAHIGYAVMDMLDELFEKANGFDAQSIGIGGRWDALTDSFLLSAKMDTGTP